MLKSLFTSSFMVKSLISCCNHVSQSSLWGPKISLSSPVWLLEKYGKPSWNHLELSWSHLEPFWNPLGTLLGLSWSSWSHLGAILLPLGARLGTLEPSVSRLAPSWSPLETSWSYLE